MLFISVQIIKLQIFYLETLTSNCMNIIKVDNRLFANVTNWHRIDKIKFKTMVVSVMCTR